MLIRRQTDILIYEAWARAEEGGEEWEMRECVPGSGSWGKRLRFFFSQGARLRERVRLWGVHSVSALPALPPAAPCCSSSVKCGEEFFSPESLWRLNEWQSQVRKSHRPGWPRGGPDLMAWNWMWVPPVTSSPPALNSCILQGPSCQMLLHTNKSISGQMSQLGHYNICKGWISRQWTREIICFGTGWICFNQRAITSVKGS